MIQVRNHRDSIEYISLCVTRTLVGASVNLKNTNKEVTLNFQNKFAGFVTRLYHYNLLPSEIYFGYKIYW